MPKASAHITQHLPQPFHGVNHAANQLLALEQSTEMKRPPDCLPLRSFKVKQIGEYCNYYD